MGFSKAFEPLEGIAPIARVAAALESREIVVVCASADLNRSKALVPNAAAFATNDQAERGMSHSLRCALAHIGWDRSIGIVLADMPFIAAETFNRVEELLDGDIDVAYPIDVRGTPGHPVLFASSARAKLEALPDGDTIRHVRDDGALHSVGVRVEDRGAFTDLDKPSDWHVPT
jgi:molybdenum cofactor cytidylyltransferase